MASDWEAMCTAIKNELVNNVAGLTSAKVHLFSPWNPAEQMPDGDRHLAVWPMSEGEAAEALAIELHELPQLYSVLVWESAGTELPRQAPDEAGDAAFLQLHNDIRTRFYVEANQTLGGADRVWYAGCEFPDLPARIRWFRIRVDVRQVAAFV